MATHIKSPESLVASARRFLFFTGKGGVGKTSLACATALRLADAGKRVLLVSTDPASNLDEVLGVQLSGVPTPIQDTANLYALNIDPERAAHEYRERIVGPFRGRLPEAALRSMEEQLSGACTLEIAAFDEFSNLLGNPKQTESFDHIVFDTAPTGHTLRLLTLPKAWTGFFDSNTSGASCLGPLAGLQKQRSIYAAALAALADGSRTNIVLVSRPQVAALREAERTSGELATLGIKNQLLVLNGRFHTQSAHDPVARAFQDRGDLALREMAGFLDTIDQVDVPLSAHNVLGIHALRSLLAPATHRKLEFSGVLADNPELDLASLTHLVDDLVEDGDHGVIMTMGKGGVGKTTIAAAIATELARRGHRVHLSTTDPAAHVEAAVGFASDLTVSRIDPAVEIRAYVTHVLESTGRTLDERSRALLEEDLRSPCTEEIAVFRAFARVVAKGASEFVVLDTAPTGHTLLLLDATEAYHREVAKRSSDLPNEVRELLPRLRDPDYTRVLIVTVPEATPVHEAAALQKDLRRAGIEPYAWIVNQSLALSETSDPVLRARAQNEFGYIREVSDELASRAVLVPWTSEEPVGAERLQQLFSLNPKVEELKQ